MAAPLYKPPTKVTTISMPFLSIVNRADPDRERLKHREIEYQMTNGKVKIGDPYHRGSFAAPLKRVTVSFFGAQTFAAGDITNVGRDLVYTTSLNSAQGGTFKTRTAAQMFGDIAGAVPGLDYNLRIINLGGGPDIAIVGGAGVGVSGNASIADQAFTDFEVYFTDASDVIMTVLTANNPYNSSPH